VRRSDLCALSGKFQSRHRALADSAFGELPAAEDQSTKRRSAFSVGASDLDSKRGRFRRLTRDLYATAGDVGFWQGAIRDPNDPDFVAAREAIEARERLTVDVLYGDYEGGQRVISRFAFWPRENDRWIAGVARHWNLDRSDPR
jgi:hypothetical protein